MNDVAIALDANRTHAASYGHGRPRLSLVGEETGLGYRAGEGSGEPAVDEPETVSNWSRVHTRVV